MARPSVNNAEYFTHTANQRNDRRIRAIRSQLGASGYGILIMILEVLTDADYTELSTKPIELTLLAGDLGVSVTEIELLLQLAEEIGYFTRNRDGNLICPDLNKWLEPVFDKRNRARQAAQDTPKSVSVTVKPVSVTETPQRRVEKSKEEKSREKKKSKSVSAADAALGSSDSDNGYTLTHKLRGVVEAVNPEYFWSGKDGTAMKELSVKLHHSFRMTKSREPTDEDLCESLRRLIEMMNRLPASFYHFKDVCSLNKDYNAILNEIKNPSRTPANGTKTTLVAPRTVEGVAD